MSEFVLHTQWRIGAPVERVWTALREVESWPLWWPYVQQVEKIEDGDASGVGALHRFTWRSRLPYCLTFDMRTVDVQRPRRIVGIAHGELDGSGQWTLSEDAVGTRVRYEWCVQLTRPWMKLAAPLARPLFAWNHGQVMAAGGRGLAEHLGAAFQNG